VAGRKPRRGPAASLASSADGAERDRPTAGAEDWAAWRDLRLRALAESPGAFGSTYARERLFAPSEWQDRLADPTSVSVLAEVDGVPAGLAGGYPDLPGLLHVVAMWVDPAARGRRVAAALLDAVEAWAAGRGLRLHLDVTTTNLAARRVYERYGFVATGERRPLREGAAEVVERLVLR